MNNMQWHIMPDKIGMFKTRRQSCNGKNSIAYAVADVSIGSVSFCLAGLCHCWEDLYNVNVNLISFE